MAKKVKYKDLLIGLTLFVLGIFLIILVNGTYTTTNNLEYYKTARIEYNNLFSEINSTTNQITEIENRYSKNGVLYFKDFTQSDLNIYSQLLDEQDNNINEFIGWIIVNDKFLRNAGYSDLTITELINEFRSLRTQIGESKIKVATTQKMI